MFIVKRGSKKLDSIPIRRRDLLATLPALWFAGRAVAGQPGVSDQSDFQADLAPFWDQLAMLPSIRAPAREAPTDGICYMFTNKDCAVCQVVHEQFGHAFRSLEMRYVIYPWPGEPLRELNHMYRREASLADYDLYMAGRSTALSPSASSAQRDLVMAVAAEIADKLVDGGSFGTPFFFHAVEGDMLGKRLFSVGDIVALGPLLDRAA